MQECRKGVGVYPEWFRAKAFYNSSAKKWLTVLSLDQRSFKRGKS